ncbi:hypothetical protein [sulfur-oxidizing endosymbiont of Gigantopelta aegis]|uniref:hypothetical protein n=1 Tax=sulfur-oxidizing endosymbiont of Gigantopelta aegis TaxID=2794934 RepID=UPI001BE4A226|nr:hypothetical protein [sulfur-oxidizing endosymbiont of Gigantopelta aegis]
MLYIGADLWLSRWLMNALVLTHLMTIGFMLMVMIGALYQFIPVMIGRFIPGGSQRVMIIHILLTVGTLALTLAFSQLFVVQQGLYWLAFIALGIAISLFTWSLIPLFLSDINEHLIIFLVRILFFVLTITIGLGLYLLLAYAYPGLYQEWELQYRFYTNIHALWGLIGWVVILLMAVSSQVIPMFFVTPEFSVNYLKRLSVLIVSSLLLITLLLVTMPIFGFSDNIHLVDFFQILLSIELLFFISYTLKLLQQRKRKIADVTIHFFYLALISLLVAICLWWLFHLWPSGELLNYYRQYEFSLGILLIYGLASSAIIGMLQKIVPFLIYLNLQNLSFKHPESMSVKPNLVPNMKMIISSKQSRWQMYFHSASLMLLIISVYFQAIVIVAGLAVLLNFAWLSYALWQGFYLYNKSQQAILNFPQSVLDRGVISDKNETKISTV